MSGKKWVQMHLSGSFSVMNRMNFLTFSREIFSYRRRMALSSLFLLVSSYMIRQAR